MNLRLRSVTWVGRDVCRASFEHDGEEGVREETFALVRTESMVGARPLANLFVDFNGSAAELRSIIGAIVKFCRAAQAKSTRLNL